MSVVAIGLMAADYSQMSMEELNALRGTIAVEERDAFKTEMQSRMQAMTPEERAQYRTNRAQGTKHGLGNGTGKGKMNRGGKQQGQGIQQRLRDGSGAGSRHKGTGGQGKGRK